MFRPTSTNSKSPSSSPRLNVRMDDLQDTVTQYGEQLLLLNRKLEEAKDKKAYLQSKLVKEQKKTAELRLQLDALKMTALEFEERERCRNAIAMNLGSRMEKVKILLEEKKQEATNLQSLIKSKICDIQMKFKNLKLGDIDAEPQEDTSFPNEEEIKHLEKETSCLQKELNSVQTGNDFHVPCEELKWLMSETEKNLCMDKQKICVERDNVRQLEDNVRQLEDDLQALQKNVGELEEDVSSWQAGKIVFH